MENFKNFIKKNFVVIVLFLTLFSFFRSCSDSKELKNIRKEITVIKESTHTKTELSRELKIMSLETEKRFIQSTDRRLMDVTRQSQIDIELQKIKE
jgi:hypothetical protein